MRTIENRCPAFRHTLESRGSGLVEAVRNDQSPNPRRMAKRQFKRNHAAKGEADEIQVLDAELFKKQFDIIGNVADAERRGERSGSPMAGMAGNDYPVACLDERCDLRPAGAAGISDPAGASERIGCGNRA
jgi:hypothetical protein